ncbi:MAG TPA: NADPH-dependent 7-cyano-7-deazaguanine reductase QueF [Prolixibacteraceae bacterium]|nr:NADPH-dependent 7-cyano-7-deazaguanine reductase QueF [Prolixibacteraceae bacterium]
MTIESTHLGKQSSYPQHYDPSVLVAVPRILNREQYQISNHTLPFSGVDVWHVYEFSFLTQKGSPVVGLLKLVYPVHNEFLVESKSLKLYLNSFNMEQYGSNRKEGIALATGIIRRDLSELLQCDVQVTCFDHQAPKATSDFEEYSILEEITDFDSLSCTEYKENPSLLQESATPGEIRWGTHLLRSNCKITHQPDWGSLYLAMKGEKLPTPESFLQYIVSLRNENHFHEEICEMVFQRINTCFCPESLMVTCLYTRRGGIDICPVRTLGMPIPENLTNVNIPDKPAFRQ